MIIQPAVCIFLWSVLLTAGVDDVITDGEEVRAAVDR